MTNTTITKDDLYAARIFFNSALPLLKVIIQGKPSLKRRFFDKYLVFQVSALYSRVPGGKMSTHFIFDHGNITCKTTNSHDSPDIEFIFSDLKKFINFFSGKGKALPKIRGGIKNFGCFKTIMNGLLAMSKLLQAEDAPKNKEDRELLVKLYFYLLTNGISQLNKAGHEKIHNWASSSPDRTFEFAVTGYDNLTAYIRVKQGNSKAGRGEYPRCKPFLTLRFDTPEHALDILMGKGDMIEYISNQYLTVEGAPEFAGIIGEFMLTVGDYAKGAYVDT